MENGRSSTHSVKVRRPLIVRAVFAMALLLAAPVSIFALPSYADVQKKLPDLWSARFPVPLQSSVSDPGKRGTLYCLIDGRPAYYFNFAATVDRPIRDGEELKTKTKRTMEIWVQYLPGVNRYEIYLERIDRLPGTGKRWMK